MKRKLDHYFCSLFGPGDEDEWTYAPATEMWYEDTHEIPPPPQESSLRPREISYELLIGRSLILEEKEIVLEDEEIDFFEGNPLVEFPKSLLGLDEYYTSLSSVIVLRAPYKKWRFFDYEQRTYLQFDTYAMWHLDEFIQKLKTQSFAAQYFFEYWSVKFLAWTDEKNQTRFVVQSYHDEYYYGHFLFDVTLDRELLINLLTRIVDEWKKILYQAIKKQEKVLGKKLTDPNRDLAISYFFPELFSKKP